MLFMIPQILIVEDNQINCLVYRRMFANVEVKLDFAHDGEAGLKKFQENNYSLVLLDIGLPKINGLRVANTIRMNERTDAKKNRTPIIAVTAYDSCENSSLAYEVGVDEYVTTPFNIKDFMRLIAKYVEEFHLWL